MPGKATVLMPGMGYEGVVKFVMDIMISYGINACPPLLVGVGVGTSIDVASLLYKKALMRPLGSKNQNERAALTEKLLEDGINKIGLGPQGMSGASSVMGVHIENCARHPSVIAVAVNVGLLVAPQRAHRLGCRSKFRRKIEQGVRAMSKKILTTPINAEDLADIKIGDVIYLTRHISL